MRRSERSRRSAIAFTLSAAFHILFVALIVIQAAPDYELPESPAPPMDVRIMPMPEPPPPRIVVPPVFKVLPPSPKPQPPQPSPTPEPAPAPPPKPQPQPEPSKPAPVQAPPRPVAAPPLPAKPLPTPTKPEPRPAAIVTPSPAPVAPQAPPSPAAPLRLNNIHKPDKEAPASVPTLPFAPAPAPAPAAAGSPPNPASGEPPLGGSRLKGLTPYPYGAMPNGGGGLRGTLVGCANPDAVGLSAAERARCNERFGVDIGGAPKLDGISPSKRRDFDRAADSQERDRKYRDSAPPSGTERGAHGFGGLGPDEPATIPIGPH